MEMNVEELSLQEIERVKLDLAETRVQLAGALAKLAQYQVLEVRQQHRDLDREIREKYEESGKYEILSGGRPGEVVRRLKENDANLDPKPTEV